MNISVRSMRKYITDLSLFFLCAFLVDPFNSGTFDKNIVQCIVYITLVFAWLNGVRRRIIHKNIRHSFYMIGGMSTFFLFLRALKYSLLVNISLDVTRVIFYCYYVPILFLSLMMVMIAFYMNRRDAEILPKVSLVYIVITLVLISLILTNDYHQLVFVFPDGIEHYRENYTYGSLYFVMLAWILALTVVTVLLILKNTSINTSKKLIWIPLIMPTLMVIYFIADFSGAKLGINGGYFFHPSEIICVTTICFWESCAQIGLIPANNEYRVIFKESSISAKIFNSNKELVHSSKKAESIDNEKLLSGYIDDDTIVHSHKIPGGTIYWTDDISKINKLKNELEEVNELLSESIELTKAENRLKETQAMYEAQNAIYSQMSVVVDSQLKKVRELLSHEDVSEEVFRNNIAKACVYNAYIKRRTNLGLISYKNDLVSTEELYLAVLESLFYLELQNIDTGLSFEEKEDVSGRVVVYLYELFEKIIENSMSNLHAVLCSLKFVGDSVVFRMTMVTNSMQTKDNLKINNIINIENSDDGIVITVTLKKDGGDLI